MRPPAPGIDKRARQRTVYHVLLGEATIADVRMHSDSGGFDIVPANRELAGAEVELVDLPGARNAAQGCARRGACADARGARRSVAADYDFIFLDCPPSLSLLTLNGLVRRRCGADSDAMRVLRARRPFRPRANGQEGARAPQSGARNRGPAAHDVRPAQYARAECRRRARAAFRRQALSHRHSAQRPSGRGAVARRAGARSSRPSPRARWPIWRSPARWCDAWRRGSKRLLPACHEPPKLAAAE